MCNSEIDAEPVPRLCSPEAICRRDRTNRGAIRDAISVECAAEGDGADLEMRGHAGDCRDRGILIDQRSLAQVQTDQSEGRLRCVRFVLDAKTGAGNYEWVA